MEGVDDPEHMARLNAFDLITPDGQPVRWAMNWLHDAELADRVYGPQLTLEVCRAAASAGLPVYFYGSTQDTLDHLAERLPTLAPGIEIAGMQPSRFRPSTEDELDELAAEIRATGAKICMVGLGCPRQEVFAYENARARVDATHGRRCRVRLPRRSGLRATGLGPAGRTAVGATSRRRSDPPLASVSDPEPALRRGHRSPTCRTVHPDRRAHPDTRRTQLRSATDHHHRRPERSGQLPALSPSNAAGVFSRIAMSVRQESCSTYWRSHSPCSCIGPAPRAEICQSPVSPGLT